MICRITEMLMDGNIKFNHTKWKIRSADCKNRECKLQERCVYCAVVDKKLTHTMYGWTLFEVISLNEIEEVKKIPGICECDKVLRLIHPAKSTIWICRYKSSEKGGDKSQLATHIVICEGKKKVFSSIGELNFKLREDFGYDTARDIVNEDFDNENSHH